MPAAGPPPAAALPTAAAAPSPSTGRRPAPGRGQPTPAPAPAARPAGARRARLRLARISPISVLKFSFILSICLFIVGLVAVAALWQVLKQVGAFDSVTQAVTTLTDKTTTIGTYFTFARVMSYAAIIGAVNVVAITVLSTIGSLLYNLCADLVGGVEVTLTDRG